MRPLYSKNRRPALASSLGALLLAFACGALSSACVRSADIACASQEDCFQSESCSNGRCVLDPTSDQGTMRPDQPQDLPSLDLGDTGDLPLSPDMPVTDMPVKDMPVTDMPIGDMPIVDMAPDMLAPLSERQVARGVELAGLRALAIANTTPHLLSCTRSAPHTLALYAPLSDPPQPDQWRRMELASDVSDTRNSDGEHAALFALNDTQVSALYTREEGGERVLLERLVNLNTWVAEPEREVVRAPLSEGPLSFDLSTESAGKLVALVSGATQSWWLERQGAQGWSKTPLALPTPHSTPRIVSQGRYGCVVQPSSGTLTCVGATTDVSGHVFSMTGITAYRYSPRADQYLVRTGEATWQLGTPTYKSAKRQINMMQIAPASVTGVGSYLSFHVAEAGSQTRAVSYLEGTGRAVYRWSGMGMWEGAIAAQETGNQVSSALTPSALHLAISDSQRDALFYEAHPVQ